MKNTAYWGKNTQSALQLCRLVASTATMEGDSAVFFFLPFFLLFYFGSRTLKVIQSGCRLHCCLCKHGGRRKETEQRRKTDQWRQRAGATRASETDQPVWSTNQLLLLWQEMIYWLHQTTSAIHFSSLQQGARTRAGGAVFFGKQKVLLILEMIWRSERIFAFRSWEQEDEMKPDDYHGGEDVLSVCCATGPPAASASCVF